MVKVIDKQSYIYMYIYRKKAGIDFDTFDFFRAKQALAKNKYSKNNVLIYHKSIFIYFLEKSSNASKIYSINPFHRIYHSLNTVGKQNILFEQF